LGPVTSNADADEVGLGRNKQINPVGPVTSDADETRWDWVATHCRNWSSE
jgi:hypothetical protein